jgi:predicted phosphodiesterase
LLSFGGEISAADAPFSDLLRTVFKPAKITKGPALLRDYQDRAAIMWETDAEGPFRLYYSTSTKRTDYVESGGEKIEYKAAKTTKEPRIAFIHKVWLDDLEPGQFYTYHIAGAGLQSKTYQFRTAPSDANEVTFIVYGDSRTDPKAHRKLVQLMMDKRVDFVVNVGDLATSGDDYSLWGPQFFEPLKGLIEVVPVYTTKGNHEGNGGNYEKLLVPAGEENGFGFDYGPLHYFCADNVSKGLKEKTQLDLIGADARNSRAQWKFVSYHVPSVNFNGHWSDWGSPDALPRFAKVGVDFVIVGHSHQYERFWPIEPVEAGDNYVTYITSGGGGAPLHSVTPTIYHACAKSVYHFCLFHIKGGRLTIDTIDIDGNLIDHLEIVKDAGRPNKQYLWTAVPMAGVHLHQQLHAALAKPLSVKPTKGQPFTIYCKLSVPALRQAALLTFNLRSDEGKYQLPQNDKMASIPPEGGDIEVELTVTPLVDVTLAKDSVGDGKPLVPALWIDCRYEIGRIKETLTVPVTIKSK